MTAKTRKQIYLDVRQNEILKQAAPRLGISEAEIVRQAITAQADQVIVKTKNLDAWAKERQFLQSLLEQGSVTGGRSWKREELYDKKTGDYL